MEANTEYQACMAQLQALLQKNPIDRSFNEVHGFLTAVAMAGQYMDDAPWREALLKMGDSADVEGISDEMYECLDDAVFYLEEELLEPDFTPLVSSETIENTKLPKTDEWAKGFMASISLIEEDWDVLLASSSVETVRQMLMLNIIANPLQFASMIFPQDVDYDSVEFLREIRPMAGPIASSMYLNVHSMPGDVVDLRYEIESIEQKHAAQNPQSLSDEQLLDLIQTSKDTVSSQIVDECVHRQDTMLQPLCAHLTDDSNWCDDADEEQWWALVHGVYILGKMTGEQAANVLLQVMQRKAVYPEDSIWEWVDDYWPALLANKLEFAVTGLNQIALDASLTGEVRYPALQCLLFDACINHPQQLENIIDFTAEIVQSVPGGDESRYLLASLLLNFPRGRHRQLLNRLVKGQRNLVFEHFNREDVSDAFANGDIPEWERFSDPWWFYLPGQIAQRQLRWRREDALNKSWDNEDMMDLEDDEFDSMDDEEFFHEALEDDFPPVQAGYPLQEPYTRETAKVGRNDPCPCGSGKKFKKCCLH